MQDQLDRRAFLKKTSLGLGVSSVTAHQLTTNTIGSENPAKDYNGPNIVLIRFGGGVRRRESIHPVHTYAPFLCKVLAKEGTMYNDMFYDHGGSFEVGHGQGTLNLLTGKYAKYKDVNNAFLGEGFEAETPTLFECLRKEYQIPDYQTLIVNGEDRTQEEFYSFSNHHLFGVKYKSEVLSLYRFKLYLLRKRLGEIDQGHKHFESIQKEIQKMEATNYRSDAVLTQSDRIMEFWEEWEALYGRTGLKNPRGDRLLTELTSRALKKLKPRLIMVNYNDPDYIHWGYMAHYTRAISIIDQGIQRLWNQCQADPFYRDNTLFAVVPDCGRDTNPLIAVPCQHHFNTKGSREIFGFLAGPGVAKNQLVDKKTEQISIPTTIGSLCKLSMDQSEGPILEDAIA